MSIIYLASVYSNGYMPGLSVFHRMDEHERTLTPQLPAILESYHYIGKKKFVDYLRRAQKKVFLDSGAFSAHTLGVTIDIQKYARYIIENRDIIREEDGAVLASVLDGIGDARKTWENQVEMERLGAKPLPCFHYGEDERYLEWYMERYDYITLGGMVPVTTAQLYPWLDRLWEKYLTDGAGRPRLKVHGFGLTSLPLVLRYPWYSVDSSSWIQTARFGSIFTKQYGPVSVSMKSPSRHTEGRHYTTLTESEQAAIRSVVEGRAFNIPRLMDAYESRAVFNMVEYADLSSDKLAGQQFVREQPTLF